MKDRRASSTVRSGLLAVTVSFGLTTAASAVEIKSIRMTFDAPVRTLTPGTDGVVVTTDAPAPSPRHWQLVRVDGELLAKPLEAAPVSVPPPADDALPDAVVAYGSGRVTRAWLAAPTQRYRHGVLGDAIEASALAADLDDGSRAVITLPPDSVFEDRHVRLGDVDGDGQDDLLVVRAYLDYGAAPAVFTVAGNSLKLLAEAPPIGIPNRWLNPVGIADFDGDGAAEVAAVVTPHIGGILTLYGLEAGGLSVEQSVPGFSNHKIGSRELGLSVAADLVADEGIELAVPNVSRDRLRIVSFHGGSFRQLGEVTHRAEIVSRIVTANLGVDGSTALVYALADGSLMVTTFP